MARWRMSISDGAHATIATATGIAVYGFTLQEIVFVLWGVYVLILIMIKLPDFLEKYPIIGQTFRRLRGLVSRRR